ncbi:hypothetical protein [Umezawaea tangerina]|uniref:Uncharacterized protein n=1 Tax=Umezawaea tangerina TaxID=84725 RepID=A0A2T0TJ59_9PSEU|nr:hypothetical protein [Umezawaea tangerina]PRY45754.1 hypothetical protein CLV43_10113 [Umezawaea tangerina]
MDRQRHAWFGQVPGDAEVTCPVLGFGHGFEYGTRVLTGVASRSVGMAEREARTRLRWSGNGVVARFAEAG